MITTTPDWIARSVSRLRSATSATASAPDPDPAAGTAADAPAGKSAAAAASLRGQLDTARSRIAQADAATCADYATTASAVFSECVTRYRIVAEAADGHAADATALMHAWPK